MADLNRVYLVGNMVADPEMKEIGNNRKVTNFTIASNRKWTGNEGQAGEEVSFIDCCIFGKQAETINEHFYKGRKILVDGRLKQDKWEDKATGKMQSRIRVVVENWSFMGGKKVEDCSSSAGIPASAGNGEIDSEFDAL
jgi:single-strand DNA-binding protein